MTTTPPDAPTGNAHDPGDGGPRVTREQIRDVARLRRSRSDRKVAGVAGGLARHLDVDPVILRVAFVVLVFFGGAGLLLYGAAWLLVPEEGSDSATINLDPRSRTFALAIAGALAAFALIGDSWGVFGFPWPVAVVALIALLILTRRSSSTTTPPAPPGAQVPAWSQPATWTPPTYAAAPAPAVSRNPRKRGPKLFWFTLALIILSEGLLGILDLALGVVADPAYPALAVGITGVMLLVGAFWGRAGGLILLGLVSAVTLAGVTAAGEVDGETVRATPLTAAAVHDKYDIGTGELVLDLSRVTDPAALDGRVLDLFVGVGRIEVTVPRGVDVVVSGRVDGPGHLLLFGNEQGGWGTSLDAVRDGGPDVPSITIDARINIGEIKVLLAPQDPEAPTVPSQPNTPNTPNTPNAPQSPRSNR